MKQISILKTFKIPLITLLAATVFCSECAAFWMKVSESMDVSIYADTGTIVRVGRNKRMDVLYDLKNTDSSGQRSIRAFEEFDCDTAKAKSLNAVGYSDRMGTGKVVRSMDYSSDWIPAQGNKNEQQLLYFVCAW
jgi:hypothetical protein